MRLTKYHKAAFVKAVMADVPTPDFASEYAAMVKADMLKNATPKVRAILQDKELVHLILAGYLTVQPPALHYNNRYVYSYSVGIDSVAVYSGYEKSAELKEAEDALMERAAAHSEHRQKLHNTVSAVIDACSTLKSAHERLPEFTKYLPEEGGKTLLLPAIANLAAELVKAGWPQGKTEAVAA